MNDSQFFAILVSIWIAPHAEKLLNTIGVLITFVLVLSLSGIYENLFRNPKTSQNSGAGKERL